MVLALTAIILNIPSIPQSAQIFMYGALRFAIGALTNFYANITVLLIEIVGSKWRVGAANSINYMYVLGELVILTFGYFFGDYRAFYIAVAVFSLVFVAYFWLVPESPRFLILKGKRKEAFKIFQRIARSNKKEFNQEMFDSLVPEPTNDPKSKKIKQNNVNFST